MAGTLRQWSARYLAPGARVELIAPAGPFDQAEFARGVVRLRGRYDVHFDPSIFEQQGYFAGDDARRLRELEAALAAPNVAAIIAARGGYGATRIVQRLDAKQVQRNAPLLVGFSDVTALHALWAHAEVASVHGNMVAGLGRCDDAQFARWCDAVEGRFAPRYSGLTTIAPGIAEGLLLGGNLAVLSALLGTPVFPRLDGAVLFLEDIGERPYRVDRMLTSLRNASVLAAVSGIALGSFTEAETGPDGVSVESVLHERLHDLGVPVVAGVPAGHLDDNAELPFGRRVTLDAANGELHLHGRQT